MSKPFFSVIVPEHNSSEFMRRGLDSIRLQTFKDYELIVVCDACSDNTADIAREYTNKVFEIDAQRCGIARNTGLDAAQGEWILFMDDDDWWRSPNAFQIIADRAGAEGEDVLCFGFYWDGHGGDTYNRPKRRYPAIWNKAWKKSFIDKHGLRFPDWKHSDDAGFHEAAMPLAKLSYMYEVLYHYNFMRVGSLTWKIQTGLLDSKIGE